MYQHESNEHKLQRTLSNCACDESKSLVPIQKLPDTYWAVSILLLPRKPLPHLLSYHVRFNRLRKGRSRIVEKMTQERISTKGSVCLNHVYPSTKFVLSFPRYHVATFSRRRCQQLGAVFAPRLRCWPIRYGHRKAAP